MMAVMVAILVVVAMMVVIMMAVMMMVMVVVVVVAEMRVEDNKVTFSLFITVYKPPSYSLFYLVI